MHVIRDAAAVKTIENTVRDVNILFVNEFSRMSVVYGPDVVNMIDRMAAKPAGKGAFYLGVGVGSQ